MSPEIPAEILAMIYAHARETYPEECCGFLLGPKTGPLDEAQRVVNRQNELHGADPERFPRTAATAYNMAPADVLRLQKSLRTDHPVRVIYHSHCDVGAYFSTEDERAALWEGEPLYPVDYLVIDAQAEGVRGAKLFRFDRAKGEFVSIADLGPV